nr:copia protein [Tanacetum cinerariifolium]
AQVPAQGDDVQEPDAEEVVAAVVPPTPTPPSPPSPVIPSLPPHQPPCPPQLQVAEVPSLLFQQVLNTCSALAHRVEGLENDNAAQQLEIVKLKARVKKLEKINMVTSSKLRRLKKVGTSQRVESSNDIDNVFNQARIIADVYQDKGIELVLSMQEDDTEVQEAVEIVTTAKLMTEVVTAVVTQVVAAGTPIPVAKPKILNITAAPAISTRRREGVLIRDPEEELPFDTSAETSKVKDKGKGILIEALKPMKKKDQIEMDAEYAKKLEEEINKEHEETYKNIDWNAALDHNTEGYKMDFFKGMKYDEILPIFQAKFDANMRFLFKSREEMEEEDQEIIKSINETPAQKAAKRRKLSEEAQKAEDLRKRLEVVEDEDDDLFVEATPLVQKVPVVDYQIVLIDIKPRYPLLRFTLKQLVNVTRLQVEEESEMSLELLRRSNRRRIPNIVEPEIRTIEEIVLMAYRTMEELLQAPTEGYGEAIVISEILAENFKIKTNFLQLFQANKFHGFERDNPHTHIRNFKRMSATLNYRDVPNDAIKLMLFSYSLEGAARVKMPFDPAFDVDFQSRQIDNKCRVTYSEHDSEITKDGKVIGKQAHASHKAKNVVSTTRCLELLHMDLFGPSVVRSDGGNRYTLVIVDDYYRYTWTRFLKDKIEAFDQFEIFSRKIQNQLGCSIVSIRTDHGKEFDNEVQFEEFCNSNGITHNFSAPRTPQSNGVVERKNRTLQEMSYSRNSNAYIVLNKHTKKVKESLNMTFDETPSPSKTSPLVDDDLDEEEEIKNMTIRGTKWVFRNKLDENGIVSRNKARLVAQGYNQQEDIDYDETYAPVARLESIRILLAYTCALDFKLFQMDVKSAFINGFIHEKVYMAQPPGFIDFEKSDHVYKLKKALYGLKQEPKAWPDIMFSVCLCARFQEASKTSHLEAVKRIFRYIKGTTHLEFWYPKGTGIEIIVYADSDHAGDYVDRKSTSGICTFVGCCLTSWFSKKQTALAISTTEAEYVSAGKACQQALWMKQALIDYDVQLDDVPIMCDNKGAIDLSKNPVQHSRTKHIEIRHHFLRDNVQKGHILIKKVSSVDNIADILTKLLKRESFIYLRLGLGMMEHIP